MTVKTIKIDIKYADVKNKEKGSVSVNDEVICEFDANDTVFIRNIDVNAENGSFNEDKIHVKKTEDGIASIQQRKKRLAKRFSLPQNKLVQLRNDKDKEVSKAMSQLLKNDVDQVIISGIKISLKNAME
jgi:hypothetical protein